jgi:hypothetical protein
MIFSLQYAGSNNNNNKRNRTQKDPSTVLQ